MSTPKFDFFFLSLPSVNFFFSFFSSATIFFFFCYGRVDDLTKALNEILVVESGFY